MYVQCSLDIHMYIYMCMYFISYTYKHKKCSDLYSSEANQLSVTIKSTAHLLTIKKLPEKSN